MSDETQGSGRHSRPDETPTTEESVAPSASGEQPSTERLSTGSDGPDDAPTTYTESADTGETAETGGADDATDDATAHRQGSIRYQDPESTTPREPTVAEARARREAEKRRHAQDEAAAAAEERTRKNRKRLMIGGGVAVGLVAVIAIAYAASSGGDDETTAQCTDQNGQVVEDRFCSGQSVNGSYGGGFVPIFLGGFGNQYHYNYGSNTPIGGRVSGGSTVPPSSSTTLRGSSGSTLGSSGTVSRGGFGVSSGSSGGSSGGSSEGSSGS